MSYNRCYQCNGTGQVERENAVGIVWSPCTVCGPKPSPPAPPRPSVPEAEKLNGDTQSGEVRVNAKEAPSGGEEERFAEEIIALKAKSTEVVSWYPHSQYDGYHPGKASVRGPFGRWFLVEGGDNGCGTPAPVADLYDDAKFAAAAMNNAPALAHAVLRLRTELSQATDKMNTLAGELAEERRIDAINHANWRKEVDSLRATIRGMNELLDGQAQNVKAFMADRDAAREELKAAKEVAARYREALEWISEQPNTIGKASLNADAGWKACWQVASAALSPVAKKRE